MLVFIFLLTFVLIFLLIIVSMLVFSTIHFEVQNFELSNIEKEDNKKKVNDNYELMISFYLFNKVKWISFHLNDKKMRKIYSKMQLEKIDIRTFEKDFKLKDLKELSKLNAKLSYFNLKMKLGTEDAILTSFIVCFISSFISLLLPHVIKKYQKNQYDYMIQPLYLYKNLYEIKFNCIIEVKIVHIINISYIFWKKRRVDKNERTSNRRSYGYSYE